VTVGKWPEEVAVLGDDAFVATSGSRIVEHIDLKTGTNERSIRAGTFPVSIVTGASEVWTADYNRKRTLFEIDASGKATTRGTLPDHVETLAFGDGALFALLAKRDSSVNSSVVRFDPKTGKQQRSDPTGKDPAGLAVGLSAESLVIEARLPVEARLAEVFTNGSAVYVASSSDGAYFRIDPTTRDVTGPFAVGEPFVMAVRDEDVVTLGHSGTLTIWDPDDGVARVKLDVGQPIAGQWMTWHGSDLVVTAHGTSDEKKGTLHVLSLE
jgi:DNA-binding beta-propeller fold protein YncE